MADGRARARVLTEAAPDTPALVIDLEQVWRNITRVATAAATAGMDLRPHTKTHKLPQLARMQLDAGAAGVQVAKLGEAEVMADAGIDDILVGYPIVGAAKVARAIALAERCRLCVSLDSKEAAEPLAAAAAAAGVRLRVLVEIDTGLRRVGVPPESAGPLAEDLQALPAVDVVGVLTHEGHVYTASRDPGTRRDAALAAYDGMLAAAAALEERGFRAPVVSVGSSATFAWACGAEGITELRPGTYVFNDLTQVELGAASQDDLAALVVATVVSRRAGELVVDAGSKSLTSDRMLIADPPATFGSVLGEGWPVVRLSEEHAVIETSDASVAIGDRLAIVPNHICPAVNLVDRVTIVDGEAVEEWEVAARGRVR